MTVSVEKINSLKERIKLTMSEKRFTHTLGVERMAIFLGELIIPTKVMELRCAALLHDIAKEKSINDLKEIINSCSIKLKNEDYETEQVFHAFAAPAIIQSEYSDFASDSILSAVFNHTTGMPDMDIFDEIIFISDFTEEGRLYQSCLDVSTFLKDNMSLSKTLDERINVLHQTTVKTTEAIISTLNRLGNKINYRTLLTRKSFMAKI